MRGWSAPYFDYMNIVLCRKMMVPTTYHLLLEWQDKDIQDTRQLLALKGKKSRPG